MITESAKSGMLQHANGGMVQQYSPMQAHMGGMQTMQVQYQAYGGKGATAMPMGKGHQAKGKGETKGKGRNRMLDAPQKCWCPMLKGPFAPEAERYQCGHTCTYCEVAGVQLYHAASWKCDVQ